MMEELVKALSEEFTVEELKEQRRKVLLKLGEGEYISQVSVGSGVSYTRQQRIDARTYAELLQQAIDVKEKKVSSGGQAFGVCFTGGRV